MSSLSHVFWLGGSACAGKTSAATALAKAHSLALYSCDEHFEEHRRRASPERHPNFVRLMDQAPEELWAPPVETQVRDLLLFYEDEFDMVTEDLREISGPVIVEGVGLLPERVAAVFAEPHRACWLIATPEFRRGHYPSRNVAELLGRCPDPQLAFEKWMARDDEITIHLESQAAALALPRLRIDEDGTEAKTVAALARLFRLAD